MGREEEENDADRGSQKIEQADSDSATVLEKSIAVKERGAELYKQQQFVEAKKAWKEALDMIPEKNEVNTARHIMSLHLNLSQVGLQLKAYETVIYHSTQALKIEQNSAKALYRRGLAQEGLGKLQAAANDLQRAARLEPRNADIRKKYEELKKKIVEEDKQQDEELGPPVHDLQALPRAFLEIAIGDSAPKRLVFILYSDIVPKTVENFRKLCAGDHEGTTAGGKPFHYKGSILHRMIPGLMIQGGDFEHADGTGGESIYGRRFSDESFRDKVTQRGLLAMANDGPNTNGSNFFVSFDAAEHLDRKHVVFGEVFGGMDLLDELEKLPTDEEFRPLTDCTVVDCGCF